MRAIWLGHIRADGAVLRGAWQTRPALGPGTIPVATFASFDKTLNVGGRLLPLRMITDVTVSPTHRRRGLMRRLMTEDLQDAVDRGLPVAALTVSEGSIYGRFGFGLATFARHIEVDTPRFALRGLADPGRVELVEPVEAWPAVTEVFTRFHAQTRGSVERPEFYHSILTGAYRWEDRGPDHKLRAAVHLDADGGPDGYVLYRHVGQQDGRATVDVVDLASVTSTAYLRLWRFLADLDLVPRVRWRRAPVADPLAWALTDPFAVRVTHVDDALWVRVLDVVAALEARPWGDDGEVVVEVADPLGHASGRYRVITSDGRAQVSRTDAAAGVRLAADTLGSLYLGGVDAATLRDSGRLAGDDKALATWAAMTGGGAAPYCITGF
jgi:predicted acetyltransferase